MKMSLQQTIETLVREQGEEILSNPALIAWLDDLGAFNDENTATKTIMRELVRSGQVRKLIESSKKGQALQFEIKTIISDTAEAGGFRNETVSDTLKKVALASKKIKKESEWPEITEQKLEQRSSETSNEIQEDWGAVLRSAKPQQTKWQKFQEAFKGRICNARQSQQKQLQGKASKPKQQKRQSSSVKRLDWDGVFAVALILSAILAVVSLFAVFCCWIYDSPSISSWGWALLGSVIAGGITLLLMLIIDD